ncbi:MAG TPA: MAPEG family protein [Xanthobacteraceae bacterium]|nr:MAPEG family protein [Xanthobacteraceae bacterium]
MKAELFWLTLTTVLTGLVWLPYILDRVAVRGLMTTLDNPSPRHKPQSGWAVRLMNAHINQVENLVVFGILVLVLDALAISTPNTVLACMVFFWARLAYVVIYTMGIPVLRTLAWFVGFLAEVALVLAIFRLI